jgi:hypothetical protein
MASEPDDVVLSARERGQGREEAMREYLAWEINLVNQMATVLPHHRMLPSKWRLPQRDAPVASWS